jgi:diaminohydroxyphosphoribosylaminopyrimidine deaminase/5-amino-6-(5-phosphoribosylamino)uracil reductase
VYVTLEPCPHHGKTPPCTDALIAARVERVVVPILDPNPLVSGQGLRTLRRARIPVQTGVLAGEAAEVLAPFLTRMKLGRPYVIAKWAQSLDGKLATHTGDSKWISGEEARRAVHRLRARVDAVLVGSGTVLTDDPLLTARGVPIRRTARRVVLDGRLRIPERSRLLDSSARAPTLVFTSEKKADSPKARRLRRQGVEVVACSRARGRLSIASCLKILADLDLTNLLVEGGPTVLSAFLTENLVDEAYVFTAPILFGGRSAPSVWLPGIPHLAQALRPRVIDLRRVQGDVFHRLRFTNPL